MAKTWAETQQNLSYCNLYKMNGGMSCMLCLHSECERNSKLNKDEQIEKIWIGHEDISMNPETEQIEEDYFIWKKGTDKLTIWEWFDIFHSRGIGWLMNEFEMEDNDEDE